MRSCKALHVFLWGKYFFSAFFASDFLLPLIYEWCHYKISYPSFNFKGEMIWPLNIAPLYLQLLHWTENLVVILKNNKLKEKNPYFSDALLRCFLKQKRDERCMCTYTQIRIYTIKSELFYTWMHVNTHLLL